MKTIKRKSITSVLLVLILVLSTIFTSSVIEAAQGFKITGYVKTDVTSTQAVLEGIKVELGSGYAATTNQSGYFELNGVAAGSYTMKISKPGFLKRSTTFNVSSDVKVSNESNPVLLWAGDFNLDDSVNMSDVIEVSKSFNSRTGDLKYNSVCDIDKDGSINMSEAIYIATRFNKTSVDYPAITPEFLPTQPASTPTPTSTPKPTLPQVSIPGNLQVNNNIRLNSIGYLPDQDKIATIAVSASNFYIVKTGGTVVFAGTAKSMTDSDSKQQVWLADFSDLTDPGTYYLAIPNIGKSVDFKIAEDLYNDPFKTVMMGLYLMRCGTSVSATYNGQTFSHGACHTNDGTLDSKIGSGRKDGTGGWHDAGDYNKYIVNAGVSVGSMVLAWEQFGDKIKNMKLVMPENSNSIPDYLDEIKYEMDWVLKMQYPDNSGKVSHKLTTRDFGGFIPPEQENTERFFTPWGSAATADFVAMAAQTARIFKPYDSAYAEKCLQAAKKSYDFLKSNPSNVAADQSGYSTGGYETTDDDDRLWAAVEMWDTTGDSTYLSDFENRAKNQTKKVDFDFDWSNVKNLAMYKYLLSQRTGKDQSLYNTIKTALITQANTAVSTRNSHGYGRPLGTEYYWGCNGSVARQTMLLQVANILSPNKDYVNTALDAIGHLFGRNQYGRSYVTGMGVNPPMNPHDRRSGGDNIKDPWPGCPVGGRHVDRQWTDNQDDYYTNEIAINWSTALIYALAGFTK